MNIHSGRRGGVVQIALAVTALGMAAWVGISAATAPSAGARAAKARRFDPPNRFEIEVALGRIGLDPNSLAAAGLSAEQAGDFAAHAAQFFRSNIASYRDADAQANTAHHECDRLMRLVQSGISTENDRAAYTAALASFASATASRQSVLNAAYQAGAATLSPEQAAALEAFHTNHITWDLPIQFLGDNRSEADWVALRDAAANDRISARLGVEPDPASHQLILSASATNNASTANANLPNLQVIQSAWDTALGP